MTVLSVIQSVAAKVGIDPVPTSVFPSTGRTEIELKETANECAMQIVQLADWNALLKTGQVEGDGVETEFPLSSLAPDFLRFTKNAALWMDNSTYGSLYHVENINSWLQETAYTTSMMGNSWTIYSNSLWIRGYSSEALAEGEIVRFGYISKYYAKAGENRFKDTFTADTDTFVLNERLLKLNMIWNWKSAHGQSYTQEFDDYQVALEELRISDRTPSVIRSPGRRWFPGPAGFV